MNPGQILGTGREMSRPGQGGEKGEALSGEANACFPGALQRSDAEKAETLARIREHSKHLSSLLIKPKHLSWPMGPRKDLKEHSEHFEL